MDIESEIFNEFIQAINKNYGKELSEKINNLSLDISDEKIESIILEMVENEQNL